MALNSTQSNFEELKVDDNPKEVIEQFYDFFNNIPFIQNLTKGDRKRAKDLPRDIEGKIEVNITEPHILEDMDYFRPSAIHFQKYGCYTKLRPNPNPNSEYGKWIRTEIKRSWHGYVRPSDGEWIPGDYYYYLNYCPIQLIKKLPNGQSVRTIDFPRVWDGQYLVQHYLYKARLHGHHASELASRGKGKSYMGAGLLAKRFKLGESETVKEKVLSTVTASDKKYIYGPNQILNMFKYYIDFQSQHTQFPRQLLTDSAQLLMWESGFKDKETGIRKGSQNAVIGVTTGVNQDKLNGSRGVLYLIEEAGIFSNLNNLYQMIRPSVEDGQDVYGLIFMYGTAGDDMSDFTSLQEIMYNPDGYNMEKNLNVWDKEGQGRKWFTFFYPAYLNRANCMDEDGNSNVTKALLEICQDRYTVKYNSSDINAITKRISQYPITPQEAIIRAHSTIFPITELNERLNQIDNNPNFYNDTYVGDLVFNGNGEVEFVISNDKPIRDFPTKDNKITGAIEIYALPEKDSNGKIPNERYIAGCLKEGEYVNTNSGFKKVEEVTLNDKLINIDGQEVKIHNLQRYYNKDKVYRVKLSSIIDSTVFSQEHPIYSCTPKKRYNSYNKVKKLGAPERYYEYNFDFKKVSELKVGDYVKSPILYTEEIVPSLYNDPDVWYLFGVLIGDGWASSNGYNIHISFNREEKELIERCKWIVENKIKRKFIVTKDKESCIEYSFCNKKLNEYFSKYFGRGALNKHIDFSLKTIPYILRKNFILGYIDTDGSITRQSVNIVSISKTLLCDIQDWLFSLGIVSSVKVLRLESVHTINNKEHQCKKTYQLNIGTKGLNTIKNWNIKGMKINHYDVIPITNHNRKEVFIKDGYIYLKVKKIIKEDYTGYIYNFECDTHTFMCNYIPTHNCDPYDDDASNTMSLGSFFVLDTWTDTLVMEYTGRPMFANDYFEICRKGCLFYNAKLMYENNKKGLFAYFSMMNSSYLLAVTPNYLKDKQLIKDIGYGNKAFGINATIAIKGYGYQKIREWLLQPYTKIEKNTEGHDVEIQQANLYRLKNRALIKELILWNPDINVDRIMAMVQLVLYREEKMILYGGDMSSSGQESGSELANDPFFTQNYDARYLQ